MQPCRQAMTYNGDKNYNNLPHPTISYLLIRNKECIYLRTIKGEVEMHCVLEI